MLLLELCDYDLRFLIYSSSCRLEPAQMMTLAHEMAEGLAHLHSHGVKHLDM
jgi:serine/threonine protein kinase